MQPTVTSLIEITLWFSVFASSGKTEINGFDLKHYLSYALWATFVARITSNWMYEFRMTEEIESGSINGLLVRPMSFFEYYLSQFLGYKAITTVVSLSIPFIAVFIFDLPMSFSRFLLALVLIGYYLFFVETISFIVSSVAFHLTKVHSLTTAKNLALWLLSGELIPIDLLPEPWRTWIFELPFCNAVYIPVGYITGRLPLSAVLHGFWTTTLGLLVLGPISALMWKQGLKKYSGTGA